MANNTENTKKPKTGQCWINFNGVSEELLAELKAEPFVSAAAQGKEFTDRLLAELRRDTVSKPVIFVGAGTCGLGAGAGKTLDAVKAYVAEKKIDASIVEVGCNGMCSYEPIVDIQLPSRTRVSFGPVPAEKAAGLIEAVISNNQIPADLVLGQYRTKQAAQWDSIPYLDAHPFLAPQVRVVLAASGIIDPTNIAEYIAHGGYSAAARSCVP